MAQNTADAEAAETESESLKGNADNGMVMSYDIDEVDGIDRLRQRIADAGSDITAWSHILSDYVKFGNNKVAKSVAIFNMNSATDCPNIGTKHCQVPKESCYAYKDENQWPQSLPYRRRQEYLWDCLDAETWAKAFLELVSRKRNPVTAIRFSEAGDFRHRGDIIKVDRIAEIVAADGIDVYTYSASDYLEWDLAENFVVNQSNGFSDYGDRRFEAVPTADDIPDDGIHCPFDLQTQRGQTENRIKCGDCRACIDDKAGDIYITLH